MRSDVNPPLPSRARLLHVNLSRFAGDVAISRLHVSFMPLLFFFPRLARQGCRDDWKQVPAAPVRSGSRVNSSVDAETSCVRCFFA